MMLTWKAIVICEFGSLLFMFDATTEKALAYARIAAQELGIGKCSVYVVGPFR